MIRGIDFFLCKGLAPHTYFRHESFEASAIVIRTTKIELLILPISEVAVIQIERFDIRIYLVSTDFLAVLIQ